MFAVVEDSVMIAPMSENIERRRSRFAIVESFPSTIRDSNAMQNVERESIALIAIFP
jgi:hypothetical protein